MTKPRDQQVNLVMVKQIDGLPVLGKAERAQYALAVFTAKRREGAGRYSAGQESGAGS